MEHFKCLFENGWTFGALDEEGLLPDSLNSFAEQRFSLESADICKDVFFFGNKQKNTFDNIYGDRKSFLVCGNPRTDMWQANCYGLYDQTIQDIKKNFGEYFLLPLNFGYYTNSSLNTMSTTGHLRLINKGLAERSEFLFDRFCKLAEMITKELKIKVIMRPHPSDDINYLKKLMKKHGVKSEQINCIGSNDAFPWISAAKLIFHNCCTTSLEAGFCGTKVITFSPSKVSLYQDDEINNLFPVTHSYEEALQFVNKDRNVDYSFSKFRSKLDNWDRLSLKYSGKIASVIADKIIQRNYLSPSQRKLKTIKLNNIRRTRYELIAGIASLFGKKDRQVYLNKFPRTNSNEIKNIVNHICKYRNYKEKPNIKTINSHLFSLTQE